MKREILEMAERMANKMTRTDCICGMDAFDIMAHFRCQLERCAPRCTSTDLEGQKKFFGKVLKNARLDVLKRSRANWRKTHVSESQSADLRLLRQRQTWRETDARRVKHVIALLSSASREVAEQYVACEWRHMRENEFLASPASGPHVTLGELAAAFGLTRSTFIRTRWAALAEEFAEIWSREF